MEDLSTIFFTIKLKTVNERIQLLLEKLTWKFSLKSIKYSGTEQ